MKLNINATAIPETTPLLEPGEYTLNITKIDLRAAEGNFKEAYNIELTVAEGVSVNRKVFDSYPTEFLAQPDHPVTVKFGHLLRSSGITMSADGVDTDDLLGKSVRGIVRHRVYTDKSTGEQKTSVDVKDYIYSK